MNQFKEVLATNDLNWQQAAEHLAQARTPFVVVGFKYNFDMKFFDYLKVEYVLDARFDHEKSRAYFEPQP